MGDGHVFHRAAAPLTATSASGSVITTSDGRRILDGAGGAIAMSIGHGHPALAAALSNQLGRLDWAHPSRFTSDALEHYATELAGVVPVDDARVFPVSGGSEAIETALKLARRFHLARGERERHVVIARSASYHGNSRGALDASARTAMRAGYEPWLGPTEHVPAVNPLRDGRTGAEHAALLEATIERIGPDRVAAFLAEPVSGASLAAAVPPDDYWPAVAAVCRRHGVLLIADEVMTGFGRTGRWFAVEHWGVRPDLVTAGKGASSGTWPLGLCVARGEVEEAVTADGGFGHGFTWSHHPAGAAVGSAVLGVMRDGRLVERSAAEGERVRTALAGALAEHPHVGDVRGRGLFVGVELVADRATLAPFERAERVAERLVDACLDRELLVYPSTSCVDGSVGDAVLLGPPLDTPADQLDAMVSRLVDAIGSLRPRAAPG